MAQARQLEQEMVDSKWVMPIFIATTLGLVMAFSASYPEASSTRGDSPVNASRFFTTQLGYAVLGLIAGWVVSLIRPKILRVAAVPALAGSFALMFVAIIQGAISGGTRGAWAWVELGPIRFQPSEFAKLFYLVYLASLLSNGPLQGKYLRRLGQPLLVCLGLFGMLLVVQRDLGMTILVLLITFAMCFLAGMSLKQLIPVMLAAPVAGLLVAVIDGGEYIRRLLAWLNPLADRSGDGYHILTMLVAIARGGLIGEGLGECPDKWGQMPEAHTDAIFCVMGGEIGLLRLAAFLVLMAWIVVRAMQIGRASDAFGNMLCCGVGAMIGLQTLINMAVATNLMPVTGLTLPYISYGGSSLISCLLAAGMVLSIYRYRQPQREAD